MGECVNGWVYVRVCMVDAEWMSCIGAPSVNVKVIQVRMKGEDGV